MSFLDCETEKKIIDNICELSIFYSEKEKKDMAGQMNISNLWLYYDIAWIETLTRINFKNSLFF